MAGFDNDCMYSDNADFSVAGAGGGSSSNGLQTDGQLWVGATVANVGGTHINVANILSTSLKVGFTSPNITINTKGGGSPIEVLFVDAAVLPGTNQVSPNNSGIIFVTGGQVPASNVGVNIIQTKSTLQNQFAIEIQLSRANASEDDTMNGASHFNSAQFTVGEFGFVSLIGGSTNPPVLGLIPNAISGGGTTPTVANGSGNISILAATVAPGTNPIRTVATAANSITVQAQISQAIAAADATKIGLSNFDSAYFTVDANGFVSAASTGFIKTITGTTGGAIPPTANNVNLLAAVVAAGTTPISVAGAASTLTIDVQTSQAIASTDATKIGLSAFNSAQFTVDANGFVSTSGTGVMITLTGNSGGAISPTAGNINTLGTGSITIVGSGSTLTTQLTGLTNHAVLVGAGTATITSVGPTATAGQILQSAGSSSDPVFSTATYPSTTTVSQLLYSSSSNVVAGLATVNSAVLATTSAGVPEWTALTDGQIVIGSTAGEPEAATLTAGTGVTITNAANSITIAANGVGLTWSVVTGTSQAAAINNGYIANNAGLVTVTLPAVSAVGNIVAVTGMNNATGWKVAQNAGNQIFFGIASTTSGTGGSLASSNTYDVVFLLCITANANWMVIDSIGNITVV